MLRRQAGVMIILTYLLVAFAYLWPEDFRATAPWFVGAAWAAFLIRVFVFHVGLIVAAIAALAAIGRSWRMVAACIPLLATTLGPTLWQYRPGGALPADQTTFAVMSVNLLMVNKQRQALIQEIRLADPDVLLVQELTHAWQKDLDAALGSAYPHAACVPREDSFGTGIYSKLPFAEEVRLDVPLGSATEPQIRAVVEHAGKRVAFYNVHLLPPWGMEYTTETRHQFADLVDHLEAEPLPVVLAGDFNFTERTPQARALRRLGLSEAFDQAGWGRGTTWPNHGFFQWVPAIRLDHIYVDDRIRCLGCVVGRGAGSDHRPLLAEFAFKAADH